MCTTMEDDYGASIEYAMDSADSIDAKCPALREQAIENA